MLIFHFQPDIDVDVDLDISSENNTQPTPKIQKPTPANVKFQTRQNPIQEYTPDTSAGVRPAPNRLPPLKDPPTLVDYLYKEKLVEEINLENNKTRKKKTRNKDKHKQTLQVSLIVVF